MKPQKRPASLLLLILFLTSITLTGNASEQRDVITDVPLSIVSRLSFSDEPRVSIEANKLTFSLSLPSKFVFTLYDTHGNEYLHLSSILHSGNHNVQIPELPEGVYFARMVIDGRVKTHKLLVGSTHVFAFITPCQKTNDDINRSHPPIVFI